MKELDRLGGRRRRPEGTSTQRARAAQQLEIALGVAGITVSRQMLARLALTYATLRADLDTLHAVEGAGQPEKEKS